MPYPVAAAQGGMLRLSGGGGFAGAYDAIPSIAAAYGMRRLRTAYTGNLLRLRRSSDNAESDFGYVANGDLDAATITTWLGGNSGYVTTWYDQSGNGKNATQTTAANQPLYVASGQNSKPVLRFDGTTNDHLLATALGVSQPNTDLIVGKQTSKTKPGRFVDGTGRQLVGLTQTNGAPEFYAGTLQTGTGDYSGTYKIFEAVFNGASSSMYIDGASVLGPVDAGAGGITNLYIGGDASTSTLIGDVAEVVLASAAWTAGNRAAAEAAANAYWGLY